MGWNLYFTIYDAKFANRGIHLILHSDALIHIFYYFVPIEEDQWKIPHIFSETWRLIAERSDV